jgi:hypothetical protein
VKSEQEALDEPIGDALRGLRTRFLSQKQLFAYLQQGIAGLHRDIAALHRDKVSVT